MERSKQVMIIEVILIYQKEEKSGKARTYKIGFEQLSSSIKHALFCI